MTFRRIKKIDISYDDEHWYKGLGSTIVKMAVGGIIARELVLHWPEIKTYIIHSTTYLQRGIESLLESV